MFRISPGGSYTNLYTFVGPPNDGAGPAAGLVQGCDGNFYGTTEDGGASDSGTVFKFSVSLSPPPYPINQITGIQKSGTNTVLTIPSIAGETYQIGVPQLVDLGNLVECPWHIGHEQYRGSPDVDQLRRSKSAARVLSV